MSYLIYRGLPREARIIDPKGADTRSYDALRVAILAEGQFILEYHLGGDKNNVLCTLTFPADRYRLQLI